MCSRAQRARHRIQPQTYGTIWLAGWSRSALRRILIALMLPARPAQPSWLVHNQAALKTKKKVTQQATSDSPTRWLSTRRRACTGDTLPLYPTCGMRCEAIRSDAMRCDARRWHNGCATGLGDARMSGVFVVVAWMLYHVPERKVYVFEWALDRRIR